MQQRFFRFFLIIVFSYFWANLATGSNIELIKNTPEHPGANYVIIYDSIKTDVKESGLSYVTMHKLIKLQTFKGAQEFRVIKMDYDPLSAYVEIRGVRVYKKDGTIRQIPLTDIKDYAAPARMIYWGARQIMLEVGRLEPGDAIELNLFRKGFTYALLASPDDDRYIPPMRGHFYDIIPFWSKEPVINKVYQLALPLEKDLQYEFYNGEARVSSKIVDAKKVFLFSKNNIPSFKREPDMVDPSNEAPKLLLSTSPDWEAKSRWFYGVNEDYGSFETTPEITAKVEEILEGAADEDEKIHRLTHWVADEIRYSGLSMGTGEGYTLHTGDMTFQDRCGVCKDKAGMLVTMLRAAGFESYAAMTMAGSRIDRIPADQFNHSVTIVKRSDGSYQLLDPTWVPFVRELWSSAEQQQEYLMGLPEGADLASTPLSDPENHYYRLRGKSSLANDGTLSGSFTLELEGQSDAVMRRMLTRTFKTKWQAFMESQLLNIEPAMKIMELEYGDPYDYSDPFLLKVSYEIPGYAIVSGEKLSFTPLMAKPLFKQRYLNDHLFKNMSLETRSYAFGTRCSKFIDVEETVELPDHIDVIYTPKNSKNENSAASISADYDIRNSKLQFRQKIYLNKRIYSPNDWDSYKLAVQEQKRLARQHVVLKIK